MTFGSRTLKIRVFDQLMTLTDVLSRSEANCLHWLSPLNYADTQADANHLEKKEDGEKWRARYVLKIENNKFQIKKERGEWRRKEKHKHFKSFVKKISSRWTSKAAFLEKFEQLPLGWENEKELEQNKMSWAVLWCFWP